MADPPLSSRNCWPIRASASGRGPGKPGPAPRGGPATPGPGAARHAPALPWSSAWSPALIGAAIRPEAELRRAEAYGKRLDAELALPEPAAALQRLDFAEQITNRTINGLIRATLPGPSVGYIMLAVARRLLRGIAPPRELEAVLRGLPHNVTTEMDWHSGSWRWTSAPIPSRGTSSWPRPLPGSRRRTAPARFRSRRRPGSGTSWPGTATARWPKSISACRAGPRSRTTSSA